MKVERECDICGKLYIAKTWNSRYCLDCRLNPTNKMREVERNIKQSKKRLDVPKTFSYKCEFCGRDHTIATKSISKIKIAINTSWDEEEHFYCCVEHREKARRDHSVCSYCGKSLKDCDYDYSYYRQNNYCCKECEEKDHEKTAKAYGWIRKCIRCGKEYVRKTDKPSYFCSRDCFSEAKKEGWVSPETLQKRKEAEAKKIRVMQKCLNCGNEIEMVYKTETDFEIHKKFAFCNKDCYSAYWAKENAKFQLERERRKEEQKYKEFRRNPREPLCATCKTSYKDCERMQSDFRILPEGARYNSLGILSICPKYKGERNEKEERGS